MIQLSWHDVLAAPAFIINMDACADRMEITRHRVTNAGYTNIRRVSAIDARTCDLATEWAKFGSPKFHPQKEIETEFLEYPGKQCCLLSWVVTLQKIIDEDIPFATVFEDDAMFHKDWASLAPAFYEHTPKDFDMCYLGAQIDYPHHTPEISRAPAFCTHAIMLTNAGARKLYDFILKSPDGLYTIDWMMKDMAHKPFTQHAYVFYVWNAIRFEDPARVMPKDWTKRNIGLVYQDYDMGTFVREW
jgi:GR25 family glycosyltransferase involved in LPS biosynthesis